MAILAEPLEELITETVLIRLDTPALAEAMADMARDDRDAQAVTELYARLDDLADMWAAGELSRREWLKAKEGVEQRLESAEAVLRSQTAGAALDQLEPGVLRASWTDLNTDRRRAILAAVVDRVAIGPALRGRNRFDPERVDVTWRA